MKIEAIYPPEKKPILDTPTLGYRTLLKSLGIFVTESVRRLSRFLKAICACRIIWKISVKRESIGSILGGEKTIDDSHAEERRAKVYKSIFSSRFFLVFILRRNTKENLSTEKPQTNFVFLSSFFVQILLSPLSSMECFVKQLHFIDIA